MQHIYGLYAGQRKVASTIETDCTVIWFPDNKMNCVNTDSLNNGKISGSLEWCSFDDLNRAWSGAEFNRMIYEEG